MTLIPFLYRTTGHLRRQTRGKNMRVGGPIHTPLQYNKGGGSISAKN